MNKRRTTIFSHSRDTVNSGRNSGTEFTGKDTGQIRGKIVRIYSSISEQKAKFHGN